MFLIDGYNLLHAMARGRATAEARVRLIALVESWCRAGGYRARMVFDATSGMKRREERGPLEIRSVAQGRTADEEILSALAATQDRTQYTVVSNDRAIMDAALKRQVGVVSCEEFARRLLHPPEISEKGSSASSREVDYWMREFGLRDD